MCQYCTCSGHVEARCPLKQMPVVGALALHGVGEVAKIVLGRVVGPVPGVDLVVFGALLVLAVAFLPRGVMGGLRRLMQGLSR